MSPRARGFTLIELLVALAVFAVLAVAAYRGLGVLLDARARVEQENRQWRDVAQFFARLENDLGAVLNRPARAASDVPLPALSGMVVASGENDAQLAFTRGGQDEAPRRVGYRLRGDTLEWLSWDALDQAPRSRPDAYAVLRGVDRFTLRYLDGGGNWQRQWPPAGRSDVLPVALEIVMVLRAGEEIRRVFAL